MAFSNLKSILKTPVIIFVILSLILVLPSAGFGQKKIKAKPSKKAISITNSGQILVRFKKRTSKAKRSKIFKKAGIFKTLKKMGPRSKQDINLVQVKNKSVRSALRSLRAQKDVEYAVLDTLREIEYTPDDPHFTSQWALYNSGQSAYGGTEDADIDGTEAFDIETNNPIKVAVIDSGIDTSHPDLVNKLWVNNDSASNNQDDDNNGLIDDRYGYNFAGISQYAANTSVELGQSTRFRAQVIRGRGRPLTHVGLWLFKTGTPNYNVKVYLRSSINGTNLSSLNIDRDQVGTTGSSLYGQLSNSVTLTTDQVYYLVFKVDVTNNNNFYFVGLNSDNSNASTYANDPYVDGDAWTKNGSTWTQDTTDDYFFKTNPISIVKDDYGHGTHVSGIIAAEHNTVGVAGTSQYAEIMTLKAGASDGGLFDSDIISAIYYAINNGAKVINMSLSGPNQNTALNDALQDAYDAGITIVAAAGNQGNTFIRYPAGYANVIGVGATDSSDQIATFSNTNSSVDLSAPGVSIRSTTPTYLVGGHYNSTVDDLSGTSMATPHVSALAAMIKAAHSDFTPAQIYFAMRYFSQDLGVTGKDTSFGWGRINAFNALSGDSTAPTISSLTSPTHPSHKTAYKNNDPRFNWNGSDNIGIQGYSYVLSSSSTTTPNSSIDTSGSSKTYSNVASGTWYFHIRAVDWFNNWSSVSTYQIRIK